MVDDALKALGTPLRFHALWSDDQGFTLVFTTKKALRAALKRKLFE